MKTVTKDIGIQEYQYNKAARRCGIDVPDFKLMEGRYFATRRFDLEQGERLHVATAGALLGVSIEQLNLDYKTLLHLTGYLTQNPFQVEEMFRRMAFNVLTDNKDDHAKNFAFRYRQEKWELTPAYDLTPYAQGHRGEHATSVNGQGRPSIEDMLTVGESIRINKQRGMEIIRETACGCAEILSQDYAELKP